MVPEEHAPLAAVGDVGSLGQDLGDRIALLAPHGHEHAGHDGEVEAHVALVAVAEVVDHVGGPLVGLGQQHRAGVGGVDLLAQALQVLVGLVQVLAVGPVPLEQVGHGVEAEAVEADVQPEADHVQHLRSHVGVVVVEVGLVGEEAVPVVLLALGVPGPVRLLRIDEDDADLGIALVFVAPDVPVGLGVAAVLARLLEPGMLVAGVVHHQVGHDADAPAVGLLHQLDGVGQVAVLGEDGEEVGDVIAPVPQRRLVEGQQPDAVDAQPGQVVELGRQAPQVPGAVVVGVVEAADQHLVEHRALVPAEIGFGRRAGGRRAQRGTRRWRRWAGSTAGSRRT